MCSFYPKPFESPKNEGILLGICFNVLYFILMGTDSPEAEEQMTGAFSPDHFVLAQCPSHLLLEAPAPS